MCVRVKENSHFFSFMQFPSAYGATQYLNRTFTVRVVCQVVLLEAPELVAVKRPDFIAGCEHRAADSAHDRRSFIILTTVKVTAKYN